MMNVCSCQVAVHHQCKVPRSTKKTVLPLFAHLQNKHGEKYTQLWNLEQAAICKTGKAAPKLKQATLATKPTVCNIPTMRASDASVFEAVCKYVVMTHGSFDCVEGEEFRDLLHKCGYFAVTVCSLHPPLPSLQLSCRLWSQKSQVFCHVEARRGQEESC